MLGKLLEFFQVNGWIGLVCAGVLIGMLFVPAIASFVYGIVGKQIVITPKPSASVLAAAKQAIEDAAKPKV